jgi:hypothetical protein
MLMSNVGLASVISAAAIPMDEAWRPSKESAMRPWPCTPTPCMPTKPETTSSSNARTGQPRLVRRVLPTLAAVTVPA